MRRELLFLIVPMLNPDGVVLGNYRGSLAAVDLNRRWAKPSARHHPTIYALKKLLIATHSHQQVPPVAHRSTWPPVRPLAAHDLPRRFRWRSICHKYQWALSREASVRQMCHLQVDHNAGIKRR